MKRISLLIAFVTFFATASFANNEELKKSALKIENKALFKVISQSAPGLLAGYTCTATASWKTDEGRVSKVSITLECGNCTSQRAACDAAYAIARLAIPG